MWAADHDEKTLRRIALMPLFTKQAEKSMRLFNIATASSGLNG